MDRIRWGEFVEVKRLGTGGMAEILLVERVCPQGIRKKFILKRIHESFLSDPSIRGLFIQEARIQSQLDHPNIVHLFDFGQDGDFLCMALEYVDGGDLCSLSQNLRQLDPFKRAQIALQALFEISSALRMVHTQIIHQDISPSNILYSKSGFFKLCDFGVSKIKSDGTIATTRLGQGKFRYMSPEQLSGGPTDHRSDIFSLGICIAEFFSGKNLYGDHSAEGLPLLIRSGMYLRHIHALDLPPGFNRLIYHCVQPAPIDRFQNAAQLLSAVAEVQSQMNLEHGCFSLTTLLASSWDRKLPQRTEFGVAKIEDAFTVVSRGRPWSKFLSVLLSLPVLLIVPCIVRLRRPKSGVKDSAFRSRS